jgi:hypothetical protein
MPHPSFETLLGYIENTLAPQACAEVESHLSHSCSECDQQIVRLRKFLQAIHGGEITAPPSAVLRKAVALYEKRLKESEPSGIQVLAKLLFDSHIQMSAAMVRGATQTRRILYSTQQIDIDLQITPEQGSQNMLGQILDSKQPDEFAPAFVSMKNNATGELMEGKETDSLGQFNFRNIPPGRYDLVFEIESQEVAIRNLELLNEY